MDNKQNKWKFLEPFIKAMKVINPDISNQEIADKAIDRFTLALDREAARKIVSRIVNNEEEEMIKPTWLETVEEEVVKEITLPTQVTEASSEIFKHGGTHFRHNKPGTYLVLGCVHAPAENSKLISAIVDMTSENRFDGIIFNGDFLDCNNLSSHSKGHFSAFPTMSVLDEYGNGEFVLNHLLKNIPREALKVYMYGNHEDRYWRYVSDMQNAKTPPPSPTEGLKLKEKGFVVLDNYSSDFMTLGQHLDIMHGVYYNDHCAKKHIDRFRGSVLFAHTHRIQQFVEGRTGGFNIGWLGDVTSPAFNYADRGVKASWQNGFAVVTIDDSGDYYVQQVFCNNNKFYFNGKCYS
jgi:hypothetical protein